MLITVIANHGDSSLAVTDAGSEPEPIIEGEAPIKRFVGYSVIDDKFNLFSYYIINKIYRFIDTLFKIAFLYLLHRLVEFVQSIGIIAELLAHVHTVISIFVVTQEIR